MKNCKTPQRQRILFVYIMVCLLSLSLTGRLAYLMVAKADYYGQKAKDVQQRERAIKAKRGVIYDRNGEILAGNKPVSTISVIHNQIKEPEKVITRLSELLDLDEQEVRKRVEKVSSIERIKANVPKETSDKIREENLAGVMVDEDYKRYYPYDTLASRVIGFTGADNQGIIGLEVSYDDILQGQNGAILTMTTARGLEIDGKAEERREPVAGSLFWLIVVSLLFIFVSLALGLLISTVTRTQVAAMLVSGLMLMMPTMLLSGMIFPIESMPVILQGISTVIPARWYIQAVRKLMIEGVDISLVLTEISILTIMAVFLITVSFKKFKNRLE